MVKSPSFCSSAKISSFSDVPALELRFEHAWATTPSVDVISPPCWALAFDAFMESVREFDKAIHSLNDEFEKVNITGVQQKVDPQRAKEALKLLKPAITKLRERGRNLLISLY